MDIGYTNPTLRMALTIKLYQTTKKLERKIISLKVFPSGQHAGHLVYTYLQISRIRRTALCLKNVFITIRL